MLDRQGGVQLADRAAGSLWETDPIALRGRPLPDLFVFEVVSDDPEFLALQWEAIVEGGAAPSGLVLEARLSGETTRPVRLRCEPISPDEGFFVTLSAPVKAAAAAPAAPGNHAGIDALVTHGSLGFFDLNLAGQAIHYSPSWKHQLGYGPDDLPDTYDTWLRLIHPEDSAAAPHQVGRRPASRERAFDVEYRLQHRRGHWVWLHASGVQLFSPDGELERVVGVQLDITERKELEDETFVADERWRSLAGEGPLAAFDLDVPAGTVWVSPAWLDLVGEVAPPSRLDQFTPFLPEFDSAGLAEGIAQRCDDNGAFAISTSLKTSAGADRPVLLSGTCARPRRGAPYRITGYAVPLPAGSSSILGPAALAELALDALQEAVILTDPRANVVHLNTPARRLTGFRIEDDAGTKLSDVFRLVNAQDGSSAEDAVDIALADEQGARLSTAHAVSPREGAPIPIVWSARHLTDAAGRAAGVGIIFRDPQEMTLTPEELIKTNRFDSLGLLAGAIAHDFNNLLTTILGGISQAKDNRDYANLGDAEEACMTAKTLTRQLLAFAKGSPAGTLTVAKSPELLRDAVRVASAGSPVRIEFDLDENASPVEVDKGQMLQVFQNLIVNAVQAMPDPEKGRLWLRCHPVKLVDEQLPPLPAGDYVQFDIQDNGAGIAPENIEKIFEPFFTTKKTGTGLGLATVLSIVRKHGGQLGVDSTVGVGTTFSTFLPVTSRALVAEARQAPKLRFGTGRVLFMDDDPKISEITANMLESLDYNYDLATNGEEALALYRKYLNVDRPYDAVIMDLTIIGGMGGEACFHELKKLDPDVRAIISSGYDNDEMVEHFLAMGFCGYLTKPYRVGDLGRMLKTVLGGP